MEQAAARSSENKYFSRQVTLAMKGTGIIWMLVHHLFCCFPEFVEKYKVSSRLISMDGVMVISTFGKVCVAFFVFLSAYGMTVSLTQSCEKDTWVLCRYKKLAGSFFFIYVVSILTCFLRSDGLAVYTGEGPAKAVWYMLVDGLGIAHLLGTPTYNETWWYMSVAVLLIFVLPILVRIYQKFGISLVVAAAFAQNIGVARTTFTMYLFPAVLGIYLASEELIFRIRQAQPKQKWYIFAGNTAVVLCLSYIRLFWGYYDLMDGLLALTVAVEFFILLDIWKLPFYLLRMIGKYSMYIFLIHTLLLEYYFTDFIYAPGNWVLITGKLLLVSLAVSVVLDRLQKTLQIKPGGLSKGA